MPFCTLNKCALASKSVTDASRNLRAIFMQSSIFERFLSFSRKATRFLVSSSMLSAANRCVSDKQRSAVFTTRSYIP